ncbi:MAG: hypothetical protein KGL39_13760 [Patescibacteria group bacterium]|nr:hypothetical protein [Patescibacteria group bacterium]
MENDSRLVITKSNELMALALRAAQYMNVSDAEDDPDAVVVVAIKFRDYAHESLYGLIVGARDEAHSELAVAVVRRLIADGTKSAEVTLDYSDDEDA